MALPIPVKMPELELPSIEDSFFDTSLPEDEELLATGLWDENEDESEEE